jgi:hypothetical protein
MVTRAQFLADPEVHDFIEWLARTAPTIIVDLAIPPSPKVARGVRASAIGVEAVVRKYKWAARWRLVSSPWVRSRNWHSTRKSLALLRSELQAAIAAGACTRVLAVCDEILRWGGDRSPTRGARPFLHGLANPVTYLTNAGKQLDLQHANLLRLGFIGKMNSC